MPELHLCQLAIIREIQAWDNYSQMQLENSMNQSERFAAQLEEAEQKMKEVESKQDELAWVVDEACRNLPNFDM